MANNNMSYLYPEFWAAGFDALDVGSYNLQNFVSRDVESKLAMALMVEKQVLERKGGKRFGYWEIQGGE